VPLFLTVNPPTSSAVPSKPKSRPTPLFSITNAPTPEGLMIMPAPAWIPRGLFVMAMVLSLKTVYVWAPGSDASLKIPSLSIGLASVPQVVT
jgi:hypothetical protein